MKLSLSFLSKFLIAPLVASAGLGLSSIAAADSDKIKVMSRNIYLGADIFPVVAVAQNPDPANPLAVPIAVAEVFQTVQATNFPERAQALADEIARRDPHVIGLQEVSQWFTGPADSLLGGTSPASDIAYDFLDILLAAMAERGLDYAVATVSDNAEIELPMFTGVDETGAPTFLDLRLEDRDVVLVRNSPRVSFSNTYSATFQNNLAIPVNGVDLEFTRGFNMLDVNVKGADYRFVNTHLEVGGSEPFKSFQAIQMNELLQTITATTLPEVPVILVGDFNSSPDDQPFESALGIGTLVPPYLQAVGTSYSDIWLSKRKPKDGFTCCFDAAVSDEDAELYSRIDHIFLDPKQREVKKLKAKVVGDSNADMTDTSGLYPSDHAGVFGKIKLEK